MKVGYIRISTKEQNTARQDELMKKLGVEKVYTDKMSGKNTERPELHKMLDFVREGDSLTVESISRFARNTRDLLDLTATLNAKGVQFISQKENIDTNTPIGIFKIALIKFSPGQGLREQRCTRYAIHTLPVALRPGWILRQSVSSWVMPM